MLKKIWTIFARDIRVNTREAMSLFIIIIPLILAVGINLITPGINDTTVNIALVKNEDPAQAAYLDHFAHVELLADAQEVENRVMARDSVIGIRGEGEDRYILAQGNETKSTVEFAKLLSALYEENVQPDTAHAQIVDFGRTIPPLKKMMVNVLLQFNAVLAGMLIALNIIEEKADKTIRAVGVTPVSRSVFILGKGMTGMAAALFSSAICLLITGFFNVNIGQLVLVILSSTILSMMVGFVQGINSNDVMEAAGSVKLMFLPLAGSIVGYELVTGNWQIFFYWSPFYWAYRANDMILSKSGTWPQMLLYTAIILAICALVYAVLAPRIRKGLQ